MASDLVQSLHEDEPRDDDARAAWTRKIERRVEDVKSGNVKMLSLAEFKKKMRVPRKRK